MPNLPRLVFYSFFYGNIMEMMGYTKSVFLLIHGHSDQSACWFRRCYSSTIKARVGNTHAFIPRQQQSLIFLSYRAREGFVTLEADCGLHFAPLLTSVEELVHPLLSCFLEFLSLKSFQKFLVLPLGVLGFFWRLQ